MLLENLFHRSHRHRHHLLHLDAGAVADVAGATVFLLSFFAGLLVAGALATSALTTAVAGASALVTAGVATGALGASAANTDTARVVAITAIMCFIIISYVILKLQARIYLLVYTTPG
jgi:hypothetical protein